MPFLPFYTFGSRMPQGIASGLLGRSSFQGGAATWILGLALHFLIALAMASVYFAASRKLPFLKEYPLICGLFYGMALYLVKPRGGAPVRDPCQWPDRTR
jgi:hypothetical protein